MKRFSIFIFWIILVVSYSFGQDTKCQIGVVGGPSFYWIRGEGIEPESHSGIGYSLGLTLEYRFNNNFAFESGIYYFNRKFYYETPPTVLNYSNLSNTEYRFINFPLKTKYYIGKQKNIFIGTGLALSRVMYAITTIYDPLLDDQPFFLNDIEFYDKFQAKFIGNIGYKFALSEKADIYIEIVDYLGLLNITTSPHPIRKSNSLNLLLGLRLIK
ncbi:MAG: PorT family protein [Bacteroidales bacterium]|nr:PorT family protein [Bacteroidales bacterium]